MNAIELIEETANYYNLNNRGFEEGIGCQYLTPNGKMCAVGRCILKKKLPDFQKKHDGESIYSIVEIYDTNDFKALLKVKYRNIPDELWDDLQSFHDNSANWTNTGLSPRGKNVKAELIKRFS